ncbi:hypothetical protein F383_11089 [Gossypium arboreum]|uniref:Uncharacterized protein n=1 Tax=Gossypium arboreum TaxID=29729 RepID=A0A0B0PMM9_GOSAR|nr:hypothetical protein F383_11089 [Gossypium arboreum]
MYRIHNELGPTQRARMPHLSRTRTNSTSSDFLIPSDMSLVS